MFAIAGALSVTRQLVGLADPAYYDPVTPLDFAAAWLTSLATATAALAWAAWWRQTPIRRGSWLLPVAAAAYLASAVGNVLGDVFGLADVGETLWTAGMVATLAALLSAALTLTVPHPGRWSGAFLAVYALGWGLPETGGMLIAGLALIATSLWINRTTLPSTPAV